MLSILLKLQILTIKIQFKELNMYMEIKIDKKHTQSLIFT